MNGPWRAAARDFYHGLLAGRALPARSLVTASVLAGLLGCGIPEERDVLEFLPDRDPLARPSARAVVGPLNFPPSNPARLKLRPVRLFPTLSAANLIMLTWAPGRPSEVFIVERGGRILILREGESGSEAAVFLDLQESVWSKGGSGLLGMVFDPAFRDNGTFYVHYTTDNPRTIVVSAFRISAGNPQQADRSSERVLFRLEKTHRSHNGGMLAFGPDGMLYIAIGDAFRHPERFDHAQDLTSLFGKILRIDPWAASPYGVPADNPFVGRTDGARPEIWAYGFRQPWRFSFDRESGDLWLGDVGRADYEEVNLVERGGNHGWMAYEGTQPFKNRSGVPFERTVAPVLSISHTIARAVIGGYVYRGNRLPSIRGRYVYADAVSGTVWALSEKGGRLVSQSEVSFVEGVVSFAEDREGNLFAVSRHGRIYRFEEAGPVDFPQTLSETGLFRDVAALEPVAGLIPYDVVSPLWSDGARKRRWMALPGEAGIGFSDSGAWDFPLGTVLVKHFEMARRGGSSPRRLETRVLIHEETGWAGYTYKWNEQQTDAELLTAADSEHLRISRDGGQPVDVQYLYPGPGDCMRCHTEEAGWVLGLRSKQINYEVSYESGPANQLLLFQELGLFREDLPDRALGTPSLADPRDSRVPIRDRARSYLAANCSNCHRGGEVNGPMDLRYSVPVEETATLLQPLSEGPERIGRQRLRHIVTPGNKELSFLWARMTTAVPKHRMPPVGSTWPDSLGRQVVGDWIDQGAP